MGVKGWGMVVWGTHQRNSSVSGGKGGGVSMGVKGWGMVVWGTHQRNSSVSGG